MTKSRRVGISAFAPRGGESLRPSSPEQSCVVLRLFFPHSTVATPPRIHYTGAPLSVARRYPPPDRPPNPAMLAFLALLSLPALTLVAAQADLSAANNVTDLEGTWSSNSAVSTGGVSPCRPSWAFLITVAGYMCARRDEIQLSQQQRHLLFIVRCHLCFPATTLTKRSTNDGYFEEVQYQYNANASNPACIQAFIYWQHGTYSLNHNGSITLRPFASDGRIQVQDPCAATTNIITYYNNQVLFTDWGIVVDPSSGRYTLNLNRYDGAKMARMFLMAKPPNMLPTQVLTGVNASGQTNTRRRRSFTHPLDFIKRSAAEPRWSGLFHGYGTVMLGVGGLTVVSVLALV